MERIGIMGGSFNPIHNRHVEMGLAALKERKLDRMIFLPTGNPPHKKEGLADAEHRWNMTALAVSGLEGCTASRCELERNGVIYTVDTLGIMKKEHPDASIEYIIGEDTLCDLPNWRKPDEVFQLCTFLVVCRSSENLQKSDIVKQLKKRGASFAFLSLPPSPISSTAARSKLAAGELPPELPPQVIEYIRIFGLYGTKASPAGFEQSYPKLKSLLKEKRFVHSLCVSFCARQLAAVHGVDEDRAAEAALLHDCAKNLPLSEMQALVSAGNEQVDEEIYHKGNLLHGYAGAVLAQKEFGVADREMLDAIRYHTTGRPGMGSLEMILFLADKIEPSRKPYSTLEQIRSIARESLPQAMRFSLRSSLNYVEAKGEKPHPSTRNTLEWLDQIVNKGE